MNELSSQQRAGKAIKLLRSRPYHIKELSKEVCLSVRGTYYLLDNLGEPVYNQNGYWYLLPDDSPLHGLYAYLSEGVAQSSPGHLVIGGGMPRRRDAKKWMKALEELIRPPKSK